MTPEIEKAIDALLNTRTFTLEAVSAIEQMRKENAGLINTNKTVLDRIDAVMLKNSALTEENDKLKAHANAVAAREAAVAKRETEMTKLELTSQFAELRRADMKEVVMSLTRNVTIREVMSGSVPAGVNQNGGYAMSAAVNHTIDRTPE